MNKVFNKKNHFGKHCVCAWIPGWDEFDVGGGVESGGLRSIGQQFTLNADSIGSSNNSAEIIRTSYPRMGKVSPVLFTQGGSGERTRFQNSDDNIGIIFPDERNLTILSIFKKTGDGVPSAGGDPRLFSIDQGTGELDHDLMIGIAGSGQQARTRIRLGTSTYTVVTTNSMASDNDTVNLIAGTVSVASPTEVVAKVLHYQPFDGQFASASSANVTGDYGPRTTTDMAIGSTAASADANNGFAGEILGVWAFDYAFEEEDCRRFYENPWQIFKPQRIHVPIPAYKEDKITIEEIISGVVEGSITFNLSAEQMNNLRIA
jgi:hypothetical protein